MKTFVVLLQISWVILKCVVLYSPNRFKRRAKATLPARWENTDITEFLLIFNEFTSNSTRSIWELYSRGVESPWFLLPNWFQLNNLIPKCNEIRLVILCTEQLKNFLVVLFKTISLVIATRIAANHRHRLLFLAAAIHRLWLHCESQFVMHSVIPSRYVACSTISVPIRPSTVTAPRSVSGLLNWVSTQK